VCVYIYMVEKNVYRFIHFDVCVCVCMYTYENVYEYISITYMQACEHIYITYMQACEHRLLGLSTPCLWSVAYVDTWCRCVFMNICLCACVYMCIYRYKYASSRPSKLHVNVPSNHPPLPHTHILPSPHAYLPTYFGQVILRCKASEKKRK